MPKQHQDPYVPPVVRIIAENTAKYGNPLGLKSKECASWAKDLQIPATGRNLLYTGCEYQMTSYIQSVVGLLKRARLGDGALSVFRGIQAFGGGIGIDMIKMYSRVVGDERRVYERLLRVAALTLKKLDIDFAYFEGELYSGALLYEYGLFSELQSHAMRIMDKFKEGGATRVIVLTPHSAEMLMQVYPRLIQGFDFEVVHYVTVMAESIKKSGMELRLARPLTVTLHDPCHLARSLKITEEPREILRAIRNLEFKEVASSKELTSCCGAPCEMVYPEMSELIASRRVMELLSTGAEAIVTLCPFCHASLSRGVKVSGKRVRIIDFPEIVYQALEGANGRFQADI